MENLEKQSGESVAPVEDPPPAAVSTQDQSTSESLVDSSAQQQSRPPPPLSPLTGCYLLIVVGEPHSDRHKEVILQKIAKAFLSWDVNQCHVSLEKELQILVAQSPEGEEARFGERLIQYATENLVTEILIHPQLNTLHQCMKNLLSSFAKHRHIVHAGYTFAGNGSWILQDGTLSVSDLIEALHEPEVIRVLKAYGNSVSIDVHCASEGDWTTERFQKEPASKLCAIRINPGDVMTAGNPAITSFINYLSPFLVPANIQQLLQPTDVVGNIRFTHPTLYVFPGGQGDAALFGINGFNMLIDGGFARKACFWDFARHLDRLDAVLLTRLNNSTVNGISAVLQRKKMNHVYPQIGHFFCNLQDRKIALSPDGDKDKDSLIVNLAEEGQEIVANLRHLALKPHPCYRDGNQVDPVNLYHKVGHGKLDMYVISPARDSQAVKEFLSKWSTNDSQLFSNTGKKAGGKAFEFPLQNLVSICALLVWQPANPNDTITRILFPGSTPQHKIFEGLEKLRHLEFLKHPVCSARSISPSSSAVSMTRSASKGRQPKLAENKFKEAKPVVKSQPQPPIQTQLKPMKPKTEKSPPKEVKETSSTIVEGKKEVEKPTEETPEKLDNRELNKEEHIENVKDETQKGDQTETDEGKKKVVHKSKYDMRNVKPKVDSRAPSKSTDRKKAFERKPGGGWPSPPGTPKKAPLNGIASKAEKAKAGAPKPIAKVGAAASSSLATSPTVTPGKSAKEANNRKVVEARVSATKSLPKTVPVAPKKEGIPPTPAPQPLPQPPPAPVHRRQVRRPKAPQSPVKTARAPRRVVKRQDIDPDVVRTYDPSIDVELGLGVETLKTDIIRQVTRGLDENQETEERTVMGGMDAAQAEEEEAKLKRDEEETEDVETDEPEEYLIITRQVVDYPHPQASSRGTVITRETTEIDRDELEKLIREEIECEKEEDVFLPEPVPVQDQPEPAQAKEEVQDKTTDETRGDKTPEGGESELQKLVDVDEGIDLKEPVSREHKEGESLPEEKISNTVETSATTAPTLPEDERIEEPMTDEAKVQQDEIKEVVEEKYTQEETKEDKQQKIIEEVELKQPPMLPDIDTEDGIVSPQTTQKKRHPRDVVKTPDEVADLPMHEEVDPRMYSSGDFTKEMQKKTDDDKTPTEKKPDFSSVVKEEANLLEKEEEEEGADKGSEKFEESMKDVEKTKEQTMEEKGSITSQYLNIIDKLERSTSESKRDVSEDIQPEVVDDKIIKESETVEEDEKAPELGQEVVSKAKESEIPKEDKLQPQDEVKYDEKRSPSPAKETEIMPQEDNKVSGLLDSNMSLQPDLSGKSTPQEPPEIISGKSSPLVLEKEMSGKATPLDLEKESSGKATPADLAKDASGKSSPQDGRKDTSQATSGKSTPMDLEMASRRHSLIVEKGFSGKSTPLDSVSGKTSPQDATGKSTPLEMVKDVSGKVTPLEMERPSSKESSNEEKVSIKSDHGIEKDDSHIEEQNTATPQDSSKNVSGKSTPRHLEDEPPTSPRTTPHDLEVKPTATPMLDDISKSPTPQDVNSGKATPIDAEKIEGITPHEIKRSSITQDVGSSGKITPSDVASGKSSRRESTVDDYDDRRSSLQSLISEKPMEAPAEISSGKSSPLGKETSKVSEEQLTKEDISRKGSSEKDIDEEARKETPEDQEVPRDVVCQDPCGKVSPSDVTGNETVTKSESYETHVQEKDAVGKKMPIVESSVSDSVSSGPPEKDVSGKSTPFSTDKETSAVGGKVTSDSFSAALAEKGTSGTYSLEKESGDKSSSPSPVDISPLSLDELKETPKEKKSAESNEKDDVGEPEGVESEVTKEKKPVKEVTTTFLTGKPFVLERIRYEGGESSGTSSPDRSLAEKSEGSLPNGMESEEECEKGILESEKHEKESQILDISSGEEEELKALGVDDDDGDSETETRRRADDIEEGMEVEESEEYVAKVEKEDIEKSEKTEKAEREAEGLEGGEKAKVKRMLITASSEDGGTETEICIQETAKFIKKEITAQEIEKAEEVVEEEEEGGDFSNLILQAKMEYNTQRSRKSSNNSSPEDVESGESVAGREMQNGGHSEEKEGEGEEEEEEEELGTLLMQARQELAFVRSKSRESQLSQPEGTKLTTTTTTTTSESTRVDDDNDIITITTILTEEREEQEDGSVKVTTTKETTTTGGKDEGTVVTISTEFESKKTEEEKSQVNSVASDSGVDKQRSGKGDGEGKTSQEEVATETSRRTSASSIISQEDLVSRKDSAKIEDFRQSSTEMSPLKTTYITSHGDSESLMTSSFYGNLPTEDEMIGKSEHHSREFRRGRGYESVTEVAPNGERTERTYFYGTEEDPTKVGRERSRYVKAYYTEEEHQREGEHSRIGVKYHPSDILEEEEATERTRFVQHFYEEEEEPKSETEGKLRFIQTFSGEEGAEHVDFARAIDEHISARGEYLGKEIRQDVARYTNGKKETEPEEEDEKEGEAAADQIKDKKDIIQEWGKPLGLPLPPRNKTYSFPRQNISTTSSLSTPSDNSDSVTNWGQPMSLPSPAPPSVQNGVVETLPTKPKEPAKMEKKVHMKKNISNDNKSSGNNTPNRRSESPVKQTERRTPSTGRSGKAGSPYLYLDLTYVPHHGNSYYSNVEFFKKIRARYYVFSGTEPSKEVYNALLEAKQTWEDKKLEVTIIPTYDTDVLGYWVAENEEILAKHKIDLSPSASRCTINLQDHETRCSAYRLEF